LDELRQVLQQQTLSLLQLPVLQPPSPESSSPHQVFSAQQQQLRVGLEQEVSAGLPELLLLVLAPLALQLPAPLPGLPLR